MLKTIGPLEFAIASGLLAIILGLSRLLALDLEKDFLIGTLRTVFQLSAVGFVLQWVFASSSLLIAILILIFMSLAATQSIVSRLEIRDLRQWVIGFVALAFGVWPICVLAIVFFLPDNSISNAQQTIPLFGLLLGNSLSAISLVLIHYQRNLIEGASEREAWLAIGANHWQASKRLDQIALRSALTPIFNAMSIVGLVSLPGVMAGQILAGAEVHSAAQFQILVMICIAGASFFGTLVSLGLSHIFNYKRPLQIRFARSG